MGRDSYAFPLYSVNADIKKVGGDDAYLGMIREGSDGKRYVLVQATNAISAPTAGKIILGYDGGTAFKVLSGFTNQRCSGVSATHLAIGASEYFWMQTYGRCDNVLAPSATNGSEIGVAAAGSGIGATLTLKTLVTDDAVTAYTLLLTGSIGWAISSAVSNTISVFIDPKFVWTGAGGPVSFEAGGDDE